MKNLIKKFPPFLLAGFFITTIFFSGFSQASFLDIIRAWVTINPLEVNVLTPLEAEVKKVFKVEARAINKGEEKIENAKAEIFLPPGLILLKKDSVQEVGVISAKKEKKVSWSIRGEEIGSYIISVSVVGELRGQGISAEDSAKVEVKESSRGVQPKEWLQNFFDFFKNGLNFKN